MASEKTQNEENPPGKPPFGYISAVKSERWGLYASAGENYRSGVFGRDSIEAAEEILKFDPRMARTVIRTMAKLQGLRQNGVNEEEPGRIHHEYRELTAFTAPSDRKIFNALSANWGKEASNGTGNDRKEVMIYYGSVDATPLFVRLIGKYCDIYGPSLLETRITSERDGQSRQLSEHMRMAVDWITSRLEASDWGLLEFKRQNPNGIANQVWKDSETSYIHENGSLANSGDGIAPIEVQGYAYDALQAAAKYLGDDGQNIYHREMARSVQISVLNTMWVDRYEDSPLPFFAMGLDRDRNGITRQIKTRSSNAGLLLDSNLLADLSQENRKDYVDPVVEVLTGNEFLTPVGIRCRSALYPTIVDFADYHGTYAVWPKETSDIAHGLYRHGYSKEARELSRRIVDVIEATDMKFPEFYFVDLDNHIRTPQEAEVSSADTIFKWDERMNTPEPFQAWTISAYEFHRRKLA